MSMTFRPSTFRPSTFKRLAFSISFLFLFILNPLNSLNLMKAFLPNLQQIFHGKYRLHLNRGEKEAFFRQQMQQMKAERYLTQRHLQAFPEPLFSQRALWVATLIEQDVVSFSNDFFPRIENESMPEQQLSLGYVILTKKIVPAFHAVLRMMDTLKKMPPMVADVGSAAAAERILREEQQVTALIKATLIALYLDVQDATPLGSLLPKFDEKNLYNHYFLEEPPTTSLIKTANPIVKPLKQQNVKMVFVPFKGDRVHHEGLKVSYNEILKTEELAQLESHLYDYGLIDQDAKFIKNKADSNSKLMAVVYRKMIDAGFFRKNAIGSSTMLQEKDIRAYLDHRFSAKLEQQFRKLKSEDIEKAYQKLPFLERHPIFR